LEKRKKVLIWMVSPGQDIVRSVAGPMACSLATIERYMEALPDAKPWEVDQHVAPVAWRKELAYCGAKRLRIGFLVDDGVVMVQPPIARAMREVVEALRAAGHEGMMTTSPRTVDLY
jgi:amidase